MRQSKLQHAIQLQCEMVDDLFSLTLEVFDASIISNAAVAYDLEIEDISATIATIR